jgi:uncharacterized membrane protein YfcA
MLLDLLMFIFLGVFSGLSAGLLGIGGGALVVPGLALIFTSMNLLPAHIMHFASATSLCIMIFTAISSTHAHHKNHNIIWPMYNRMVPLIVIGTVLGAVAATFLHSDILSFIFALFLLSIGVQMLRVKNPRPGVLKPPKKRTVRIAGIVIGIKSGLLGIGGGTLSVPFLVWCNIPMKQSSGTSAAFTLPIAIMGTISFLFLGWGHSIVSWSTGYIYWPAVLCVAPFSVLFAQVGAKWASFMPAKLLKRLFAVLLLLLSVKMFLITF